MTRKILLTSAGFENKQIGQKFVDLLDTPVVDAKILFIPTAAINVGQLWYVGKCIEELYQCGLTEANLILYNLDRHMPYSELGNYDAIYFTGGSPKHLLNKVKEADFVPVLIQFVDDGGVYVGVSAGSILASDINLVNCKFDGIHCQDGSPTGPIDLSVCPDIRLTDSQALLINDNESIIIK